MSRMSHVNEIIVIVNIYVSKHKDISLFKHALIINNI